MKILTSFTALDLDPEDFPKELDLFTEKHFETIHDAIQTAYTEAAYSVGSELCNAPNPQSYIFGMFNPEELLAKMVVWNEEIKAEFIRAILELHPGFGKEAHVPSTSELPMDNAETYSVACAARELDGLWFDYAIHGVYLENEFGWASFTTMIAPQIEERIRENPNSYFIMEVTPK